jgi:hypothetical protein
MDSDGSALKPWTSIQTAVSAAGPGAIVAIASGSYHEDVLVRDKPVRLWGVCPRLVEVVGAGVQEGAIVVLFGASGSEVRDLALTGDNMGVVSSGSLDVAVERVWVHSANPGIVVQNNYGPTSMTVRGALVEQNHHFGLFVGASELAVETSVVRATQPNARGFGGSGVGAMALLSGAATTLFLQRSLVEQNYGFGVLLSGSEATLEASVIRATQPDDQGLGGRGVAAGADLATDTPSTLLLQRSLVEQNHEEGVVIEGSEATLEASVVRTTQPNAQQLYGRGVWVRAHLMTRAPSTLFLQRSLVDQNHNTGVIVDGSEATLEASVVRATQPDAEGRFGRGVSVRPQPTTGVPATLFLQRSLVEQNHEVGVFVDGSEATLEESVVRATQVNALGLGGRGVNAQWEPSTGASATLFLQRSLIEQSHEAGVFVIGSVATIASCVVRDTLPDAQGLFGDGVGVVSESAPARVRMTATRIEQSTRAAVAAWGAQATVGGSVLQCQAFDLDSASYHGTASTFEDLGGNLCGCPEASVPCKALSAQLQPPL